MMEMRDAYKIVVGECEDKISYRLEDLVVNGRIIIL
jgi:hypothetical protein